MARKQLELNEKKGLWANIHAKRKRGEKMNPKGHPDAPTSKEMKMAQEAIQRRMDRMVIIATDPATGRKVVKIAPKKEIEIGKGKQESFDPAELFTYFDEQHLEFVNELPEETILDIVEFAINYDGEEEITEELLFAEETRDQLDEWIPLVVGAANLIHKGYKAYKGGRKLAQVIKHAKRGYTQGRNKQIQRQLKPDPKQPPTKPSVTTTKLPGGATQTTKISGSPGGKVPNVMGHIDDIGNKFAGYNAAASTGSAAITGDPLLPQKSVVGLVKGTKRIMDVSPAAGKREKTTTKKKDMRQAPKGPEQKPGGTSLANESYVIETDINENIIGATFAKGDNQGNFNNEVNAVRDALAQIQELSPQTISSYQKKAGKQYRQAKGERPMHPEYSAGLNAAGKMTDKDMEDSDKAYDTMKKRGKGLAMSKGKGVQKEEMLYEEGLPKGIGLRFNPKKIAKKIAKKLPPIGLRQKPVRSEEVQVDEIAPVIQATNKVARKIGTTIGKGVKNLKGKGIGKIGPDSVAKPQPKAPLKPLKHNPKKIKTMPSGKPMPGKPSGFRDKGKAKPAPRNIEGNLGPRKPKASKLMGPQNQMQSYDYGIEEGAMKDMVTKKQEDERLAKRKKDSEYSDKEVRMGKGVAFDKRYKGGNMTGAYKTINKIKKGLGDHPKVADALRRANEEYNKGE